MADTPPSSRDRSPTLNIQAAVDFQAALNAPCDIPESCYNPKDSSSKGLGDFERLCKYLGWETFKQEPDE